MKEHGRGGEGRVGGQDGHTPRAKQCELSGRTARRGRAWLWRTWKEKIRSEITAKRKGERRVTAGTEGGRERRVGGRGGGSHAHRPPLHKAG